MLISLPAVVLIIEAACQPSAATTARQLDALLGEANAAALDKALSAVKTRADRAELERLAALLEMRPSAPETVKAESALRQLFLDGHAAPIALLLEVMATRKLSQLDLELAGRLPRAGVSSKELRLWLAASQCSGAIATEIAIEDSLWKGLHEPETRTQLLRALHARAPDRALEMAFKWYHPGNDGEFVKGNAAPMVIEFIDALPMGVPLSQSLAYSIDYFVAPQVRSRQRGGNGGPGGSNGDLGSLPRDAVRSGASGSPRYQVHRKLIDRLIADGSIMALRTLLWFTLSDSPDLAQRAITANYRRLVQTPWVLTSRLGGAARYFRDPEASPLRRALGRYGWGVPPGIIALHFEVWRDLEEFQRWAQGQGWPVPPSGRRPTTTAARTMEREWVANSVADLTRRFGLPVPAPGSYELTHPPGSDHAGIDVGAVWWTIRATLTASLQKRGAATRDIPGIVHAVVDREIARQALVMLAINAWLRRHPGALIDVAPARADAILDRLSELTGNEAGAVRSAQVADVGAAARSPMPAGFLVGCAPRVLVTERALALGKALYRETLAIHCDERVHNVTWIGGIPQPLLAPLRRHPRLLDFPGYSLSLREIAAERPGLVQQLSDVDAVQAWSDAALIALLNAASAPERPWEDVRVEFDTTGRDSARQAEHFLFFPPEESAELAARNNAASLDQDPNRLPRRTAMMHGIRIASSDSEYEQVRTELFGPVSILLDARVKRLVGQGVLPAAQDMPSCEAMDFLCWLDIVDDQATARQKRAIAEFKGLRDHGAEVERYALDWNLDVLAGQHPSRVQLQQMVLRPNRRQYAATYELFFADGTSRYVSVEGNLDPLPEWLTWMLDRDPTFLATYAIDLGQATQEASIRIAVAWIRQQQRLGGLPSSLRSAVTANESLTATELLERTGLLYSNPIVRGVPNHALLQTTEGGRLLLAELDVPRQLQEVFGRGVVATSGTPNPAFLDAVRGWWRQLADQVRGTAAHQIQSWKETLKRNSSWTFGVQVSSNFGPGATFAPVPSVSFGYGQVGISAGYAFSNSILISGSWNGLPLVHAAVPAGGPDTAADPSAARDAMLASGSLRLPVLPTIVAPQRGLASVSARHTNAAPPTLRLDAAAAPLAESVAITVGWAQVPPAPAIAPQVVPPGPGAQRALFSGMVSQALPYLTPQEVAAVSAGLAAPQLPAAVVELVATRAAEAPASHQRIQSTTTRSLVPEPSNCPPEGCAPEQRQQSLSESMRQRNTEATAAFDRSVASLKARYGSPAVFADGLPATAVVFGNDFAVMEWRFSYRVRMGGTLTLAVLEPTPEWLAPHMRQEPSRQLIGQLAVAAEGVGAYGSGQVGEALRKARASLFSDAAAVDAILSQPAGPNGQTVGATLQAGSRHYWSQLDAWVAAQANPNQIDRPFIPPTRGAHGGALLLPPFQFDVQSAQSVAEAATEQRHSEVYAALTHAPRPIPAGQNAQQWSAEATRDVTPETSAAIRTNAAEMTARYQAEGYRYGLGAHGNRMDDCSGFVGRILARSGVLIPLERTKDFATSPHYREVLPEEARAGDVLWAPPPPGRQYGHVGIYNGQRSHDGGPMGYQMGETKGAKLVNWQKAFGKRGSLKYYRPVFR